MGRHLDGSAGLISPTGRLASAFSTTPTTPPTLSTPAMNSNRRNRRQTAIDNPQTAWKVRLPDGTMAAFSEFNRALAISDAVRQGSRRLPHQVGFILQA